MMASIVTEGKKDKFQVYALCNLYLIIFIRKNNNKWKFTGTMWQESVADKVSITVNVAKLGETTRQLTTNKLKSSEILEVLGKRISKPKSRFLT